MRLNLRSSTWASVAISSVLARPGTPTIRLLPPTKSVLSTSSTTSLWPTMRFCSSVMICLRPVFILSASAMSSVDSNSAAPLLTESTSAPFPGQACRLRASRYGVPRRREAKAGRRPALPMSRRTLPGSMQHAVHDVVDAELVRLVRFVDRLQSRIGELPELRDVGVEIHNHHQPFARVVVLEDAPEHRLSRIVVLRNDIEIVDFEE